MEQYLTNANKDVLGYMDALHWKAVRSQNTVWESTRDSFAVLVQRLQASFTQEVVVVSKSVDDDGSKKLIEFCDSISVREVAAEGWLGKLVSGDLACSGTSAVVPEADETSRAGGAGFSKY